MERIFHTLSIVNGLLCLFCLFCFTGCTDRNSSKRQSVDLPQGLFRDGDIAFRRGTGITSRIVLAADRKGNYSHTGILKKENGKWYVIHAVPGEPDFEGDADRVKVETIEQFFEPGKAVKGAVMRVSEDSIIACKAAKSAFSLFQKRVLFDHSYNLKDTTEMYCTELIDYVYRKEGVDLPEGRISSINIPGLRGNYLLPNDIAQSKRLCLIYYF